MNERPPQQEYVKLPVVVEAMRMTGNDIYDELAGGMTGSNFDELVEFAGDNIIKTMSDRYLLLETPRGRMKAMLGDYLVKGIEGDFYTVPEDIFREAYCLKADYESRAGNQS